MNLYKLKEMYEENPAQFNDPQAFLATVNAKTITQTVKVHTTVVEEERLVSFAEMNGGPCTLKDLQDAQALIRQQSLVTPVLDALETVKREILDGTITTRAQLKTRLAALI